MQQESSGSFTCRSVTDEEDHIFVDLPAPIAAYIAIENGHDTEAVARCFTDHAVVRDEGRTIEGLTAIKQWNSETQKKYQRAFGRTAKPSLRLASPGIS